MKDPTLNELSGLMPSRGANYFGNPMRRRVEDRKNYRAAADCWEGGQNLQQGPCAEKRTIEKQYPPLRDPPNWISEGLRGYF